jgi:hypothetical protein
VIVSAYGAIILGGLGSDGSHIADLDGLVAEAARNDKDLGQIFQMVFAAAAVTLAIAYVGLLAMKELPLRGAAERQSGPGAKSPQDPSSLAH